MNSTETPESDSVLRGRVAMLINYSDIRDAMVLRCLAKISASTDLDQRLRSDLDWVLFRPELFLARDSSSLWLSDEVEIQLHF